RQHDRLLGQRLTPFAATSLPPGPRHVSFVRGGPGKLKDPRRRGRAKRARNGPRTSNLARGGRARKDGSMPSAIDVIRRRLKEDRVPDIPDDIGEKKKRPREVAFMDVNLCWPCGKCPEFCPVQCIEYLAPGTLPGRGQQPVQDRFQECIGCYICV